MNTSDCERVRLTVMAALDGETGQPSARDHAHLSTCASCAGWLDELRAIGPRLQGLSYQPTPVELWPAIARRLDAGASRPMLWPLAGAVLAWRAVQLFADLPLPALHPLVALLMMTAAASWIARDALAIETSAPELNKRGV